MSKEEQRRAEIHSKVRSGNLRGLGDRYMSVLHLILTKRQRSDRYMSILKTAALIGRFQDTLK